ncbi:HK97 family phage prohead protease [Bacillus paranthracis]|uniref:HK97 family phage prohead protease n=1 Tax=Bacillus paranthracis TaxID=2026186 RepID=UPI0002B8E2B7|nr:HK97 family phage prohead protease [Bacillus paranthracis]MCC2439730.1 HK97 family phage prohead protease [Bacillus paranthracis]MDG1606224.1 HK97 family phage prohead protease [Bacillus paranthracis]RGO15539.1 HK97 family phage prohead protease [Bacillus cereus]
MEIRCSVSELKLTTRSDSKGKIISGYAVKWDKWSNKILGSRKQFYEKVKKGAFKKSLKEKDQIALFNHNKKDFLGKIQDGSLTLEEDSVGLSFKLILPDNDLGQKVHQEVTSGKLSHVSFTFVDEKSNWETKGEDEYRTIVKARLREISPVYSPAYPDTTVVEGDKRQHLLVKEQIDQSMFEIERRKLLAEINRTLKKLNNN